MSSQVPAFISYAAEESSYGHNVKSLLAEHGIDGFLAHDDLGVSEEWQARILEELSRCEVFIPLLSKAFKASEWCSQEVGAIVCRPDIAIVPLSIDGTPPFGFLAKYQARRIPVDGVTKDLLISPIVRRHPHKLIPGLIAKVEGAGGWRTAEAAMAPLVQHFKILNQEELDRLVSAAIENYEVWSASQCAREFLPELLSLRQGDIKPDRLVALEYQIRHQEWYTPSTAG